MLCECGETFDDFHMGDAGGCWAASDRYRGHAVLEYLKAALAPYDGSGRGTDARAAGRIASEFANHPRTRERNGPPVFATLEEAIAADNDTLLSLDGFGLQCLRVWRKAFPGETPVPSTTRVSRNGLIARIRELEEALRIANACAAIEGRLELPQSAEYEAPHE